MKKNRKIWFNSREKGMTLVEVVLCSGIMAVMLLAGGLVLITANQASEDARMKLLALNAAKSTLETVKSTPLATVPAINTAPFIPAGLTNGAIAITTNPANLAGQTLATVTVTVTWRGSRNILKTLNVSTMRSSFN